MLINSLEVYPTSLCKIPVSITIISIVDSILIGKHYNYIVLRIII